MLDISANFGCAATPFSKGIGTNRLYISDNFRECHARLEYGIHNRQFSVLTAPSGCGKSTLLRYLRDNLDARDYLVVYIAESQLTPRWLYNKILEQFGQKLYYYRGDARKAVHEQFAIQRELRKKEIVCIIDEAHLLMRETLEELRFFLNCDMDSVTPVSLILCGQSELMQKLGRADIEAISQRIETYCYLRPLDKPVVGDYIRCHLEACGCTHDDVFTGEAVSLVADYSRGLPRLINKACLAAMTHATAIGTVHINAESVRSVIEKELT